MKKFKAINYCKLSMIVCVLSFGILLASCSSDEKTILQEPETNVVQEPNEIDEFISSVDALNAKYPNMQSRGSFRSGGAVAVADAAGFAAGAGIGRWVGGAIGSAGGVGGAILGTFLGGKLGPYVCTYLASGAANFVCSRVFSRTNSAESYDDFQFVGIVTNEDSLGYYHNQMMEELNNNRDKYVSSNGTVDYDLIYTDIIDFLKKINRYDEAFVNPMVKTAIINQIKEICSISRKYTLNPESEKLVEEQCEFLKDKCQLTNDDIKLYKDFNVKLLKKCSNLSNVQIKDYSKDLNLVIKDSKFSDEKKEELSLSADLTINSSMCWDTNF